MKLKNWPVLLKRTMIVTFFLVIVAVVLMFLNDDFVGILAMPLFAALWNLAITENIFISILYVVLGAVISLLPYILVG